MRNVKLEQGLDTGEHWPHLGVVTVAGDPDAAELPPGLDDADKEKIIQSWGKVAILKVEPDIDVRLMFVANGQAEFLREPITTENGLFGVHVGPKETMFLVFPDDSETPTNLELVTVTSRSDPSYPDLPLY